MNKVTKKINNLKFLKEAIKNHLILIQYLS